MNIPATKIVIIGAGIGGLTCAIACRQSGLDVLVLEKSPYFAPIGAGIQIPPNATRVLAQYNMLDQLLKDGVALDNFHLRRWQNGNVLLDRGVKSDSGLPWLVIHRADYHRVLVNEAKRLGVKIRLGSNVETVKFEQSTILLSGGEVVAGDVIVGADGIWSNLRNQLLQHPSPPLETGDLAYRATLSRSSLSSLDDPTIEDLMSKHTVTLWMGPSSHAVFYPMRSGEEFNLVLLCPDNLPSSVRTQPGNFEEMREVFKGWDPVISKIISKVREKPVLKWKLLHHKELTRWTRECVALLGDSCHPSLPYQAQGAAMAVEDAAVLGTLLGLYQASLSTSSTGRQTTIPEVLKLYESLQKERTTTNVQGAVSNRSMYHMADGPEQEERDMILMGTKQAMVEGDGNSKFIFIDSGYQKKLLGRDSVADARRAWQEWTGRTNGKSFVSK